MPQAQFPFIWRATPAVDAKLGPRTAEAAVTALKAVLAGRRGLEIAHQQIKFYGVTVAFSSHVSDAGAIIVQLDIGDPRLGKRVIAEDELRRATKRSREPSRR